MDYDKYMVNEVDWVKNEGQDEDTMMPKWGESEKVKCFSYGKNLYIRENTSDAIVSAKVYLVSKPVKVGDKLDGQIVKSVNNIPEFDGSMVLYECLTWDG